MTACPTCEARVAHARCHNAGACQCERRPAPADPAAPPAAVVAGIALNVRDDGTAELRRRVGERAHVVALNAAQAAEWYAVCSDDAGALTA